MNSRSACRVVMTLVLLGLAGSASAGEDILVLKNGDHLTGEIKKLVGGDIHIDADYGENIFIIDWGKVERVESKSHYVFETSTGHRYAGSLKTDPEDPTMVVISEVAGDVEVPAVEVVTMAPFDTKFWDRVSLNLDFGYSLTKANNTQQLSMSSYVKYLEQNWAVDGGFNTIQSIVDLGPSTETTQANAGYRRFLGERWFALASTRFNRSDEQRLDLRSTVSGGIGAFLKHTQQLHTATAFGVGWMNELYFDPDIPRTNSAEGFAGVELDAFDIGDLSFKIDFTVFPSFSQWGRVRFNFDSSARWEIIDDFFFGIGYFHIYDSDPLNDASKNDFGFTTSVGWSL